MGMQTILDKLVKDTIIFVLFNQTIRVFIMALIVEFARPLSDGILFIITTLLRFFSALRFLSTFSIIMVRYILVFYHTYLNIFDEKVTRRIIRCFVFIFSRDRFDILKNDSESTIIFRWHHSAGAKILNKAFITF